MATWIAVSSEVPSYTSAWAQDFRFRHCLVRLFMWFYSSLQLMTFIWIDWFVKSDVTPWQLTLMTVNAAHLVSWLSVYMVHLCWVCAGLGRAFWISWLSVLLQCLCISYHGWTIARKDVWCYVCAKNCFPHFTLPPLVVTYHPGLTNLSRIGRKHLNPSHLQQIEGSHPRHTNNSLQTAQEYKRPTRSGKKKWTHHPLPRIP